MQWSEALFWGEAWVFDALPFFQRNSASKQPRLLRIAHRAGDGNSVLPESSYLEIKPHAGIIERIRRLGPLGQGVVLLVAVPIFGFVVMRLVKAIPGAETLLNQSMQGSVWDGLGSFFLFKLITDPQPFEMLTICLATPLVWRTMPSGWRLLLYPIAGQMMYLFVSHMAFIPTEYALLRSLRTAIGALGAL